MGCGKLNGRVVNLALITFSHWIEANLRLPTKELTPVELPVQVLVTYEDGVAEKLIIEFNVIEHQLARGIAPPQVVTEIVRT